MPRSPLLRSLGFALAALAAGAPIGAALAAEPAAPAGTPPGESIWKVQIERGELAMPDGVQLAITRFRPVAKQAGEKFPALLELLPYRKDDSFYRRDYPLHMYFAAHGYLSAKVDVRGTGSSAGTLPDREYSSAELADAVEIVRQLAAAPDSNGRVGMWGISWGGFNALMTAARKPPALAAIVALDASDDLFHDDVHYLDGILHFDPYHLEINHENALPRSPDYALDEAYFRDRFDREPWLLTYLRQARDGEFWRRDSLRFAAELPRVPLYLIGGLLDGYRDTVPRLVERWPAPVKAVLGPWSHDWPDDGVPGPHYEWRRDLLRFWGRWLRGEATGIEGDPKLTIFLRGGDPPARDLATASGSFRAVADGRFATRPLRLHPTAGNGLGQPPEAEGVARLAPSPGSGWASGLWWGDPTGDLRPDDAGALTFDTAPLSTPLEIAGFPGVRLTVTPEAPGGHWVARLEDVSPDGRVALVTAAAIDGEQRLSRLDPEPLVPGRPTALDFALHFTTWTFQPGHRVRLAVSAEQFPMLWPSATATTTVLATGEASWLELPIANLSAYPEAALPAPEPRLARPDARALTDEGGDGSVYEATRDLAAGVTRVTWEEGSGVEIDGVGALPARTIHTLEHIAWSVSDADPRAAGLEAQELTRIAAGERRLELETRIEFAGGAGGLTVTVTRTLREKGATVRERVFRETIPRSPS
ncbi:MAG: CocE/NonD family hydrolase [Thermoanaerobaculia bacterium]